MREILFKAKRIDNGEWVEGDLVHGLKEYKTSFIFMDFEDNADIFEESFYEVIPETVCQYTGHKDKNGVKIFDSDIVRYDAGGELIDAIIEHDGISFELFDLELKCFDQSIRDLQDLKGVIDCEVIGSIHDKKEVSNA